MTSFVKKLSPAKINLYLNVKGIRKDGYHNIESLMTFCNYGDMISVEKSEKFKFSIDGPFSNTLENKINLIELTVKRLEDFYQRDFKIDILLTKKLPIASGMGGGSSNAATIIRCIEQLFELKPESDFDSLLVSLGADVPFCYYGKTALVEGIGEKISFTEDLKEYFVLLINPRIEISTKEIFENFILDEGCINNSIDGLKNIDIKYVKNKRNDLEAYAIKKNVIIRDIISFLKLSKGSIIARMTGSGATCFALYEKEIDLNIAKNEALNIFRNSWIVTSRLVNSLQYI